MEDTIIATYCLCEEFLKAARHRHDPQEPASEAQRR